MMKRVYFTIFYFFSTSFGFAQTEVFNELLKTHVDTLGIVDYRGLAKDQEQLEDYLTILADSEPQEHWSKNKKKAFWINAYNAYTLSLILRNKETKSINNIKIGTQNAWNIPFVKVGGKTLTLDFIEHQILRKELFDPRIHVGVNCASTSCPKLANFAFTEADVNNQLEALMFAFVNDPKRNSISKDRIAVSQIFNWFQEDFTKESSLIDYLNQYSKTKINSNARIRYLPYNWNLNGN